MPAANVPQFLPDLRPRPIKLSGATELTVLGLILGQGNSPLEVVITTAARQPSLPTLRTVWKNRQGGRPAPVLLVVLYGDRSAICGPAGEEPPAYLDVDTGQVERICRDALEQPDRHAALRSLRDALPAVESKLPGLRNEGFFATHELANGARLLDEWSDALTASQPLLSQRGEDLLKGLGFKVQRNDQVTSILRSKDEHKLAVAVLLHQSESPDLQAPRFNSLSPVSYAMSVADRENLPYVIVSQGAKLRLYPVKPSVGVGRRGRTETYVELHAGLIRSSDAAYLSLLFSAAALTDGGTVDRLLVNSRDFAGDLAVRLRERIYNLVVPKLAEGLVAARRKRKPTAQDLADTYEMAMTLLFRLLFIAYAEDRQLLPYRLNQLYRSRALKTKARELLQLKQDKTTFGKGDSLWQEMVLLFSAVEKGNETWGVPEYDGGLFATDETTSRVGAALAELSLPDTIMGPVLTDLLLIETPEGWGPVDFRSLGVREFGTIYEGLLESELSLAAQDLTLDREGYYRPAKSGDAVYVHGGHVYLHNRSGARKASGAYFTKQFAVEHLLDHALEPALAEHLERVNKLDVDAAATGLFDFRVADIAMGSGHFLVAAIDRVERAFTRYLAERPLAGVRAELANLRASAQEQLGPLADQIEIEDTQLLRRLIARRCIYGVDLNPISVNLARLGIWIHTFVPGLPLSLLDHNLVVGNALVGIGRLSEFKDLLEEDRPLLGNLDRRLLGEAMKSLDQLAHIADRTATEVKRARKALEAARAAVAPAAALCDIATACRLKGERLPIFLEDWDDICGALPGGKQHAAARKELAYLPPFHLPIAFPEVFLRERSGFDCILGNPPWEKPRVEEHGFWARHQPGLRSLSQREYEARRRILHNEQPDLVALLNQELVETELMRNALMTGPFPGMGTGDPDLYKAFCWRFWHLLAPSGWIGVVLPRSALAAKGSTEFRLELFQGAEPVDIAMLVNNRQWVFSEVHPQYSIGLTAISKRKPVGNAVKLRGPFATLDAFLAGHNANAAEFAGSDVREWTDTASLPLLPTEESLEVFAQLRTAPRLDLNDGKSWRARPHTELHATGDKGVMDLESEECPSGFWPAYKGESFDIWQPDSGRYYAWADSSQVTKYLLEKRRAGSRSRKSAYSECNSAWIKDDSTLPCLHPRIAFRDVTRATDTRTVRLALIPPRVTLVHLAPYFLFSRGDSKDVAYLLGVLSSIPLDWYARRFVETHLTYAVLNPFPIPRPDPSNSLAKRTIALSGRLAAVDDRYAEWAAKVGVECGRLDDDTKHAYIHELDAVVAHLYGLSERQLTHVFETFHEGWDYEARLSATLKHFRAWKARL